MKKIIVFILMIAASSIIANAQDGWFWQYPKPQGNTLNDIFVFNENSAIAVGELGTVIKTTDGGESWDVRHHVAGTSNSLSSVCFVDDHTGWMVDNSVVLKTTDGGKTWFENYNGADCFPSLVHFVNADTGFIFGKTTNPGWGYGICCKTTNGGENWTCSDMPNFYTLEFTSSFFTSPDTGWVTVKGSLGNELYKTTDCGATWSQIAMPQTVWGINEIQFVNDSSGFIIDENGGFLKTRDAGESWEYHSLGSDEYNLNFQRINSMCFTDSIHGWLVGIRDNLNGLILRTNDGGVSWVQENMAIPGFLYKVSFSDSLHGWIVGQFGLIYRTTDGGETWVTQRKGDLQGLSCISFVDENNGWAVDGKGTILHTADGGSNWDVQNAPRNLSLSSVRAIDMQTIIAVGAVTNGTPPASVYANKGTILRTTNGGQTWVNQIIDSTISLYSVSFPSFKIGWVVGYGPVFKTTDGGETWYHQNKDINGDWRCVQFTDENTGWILGYLNNIILFTKDAGKTWETSTIHENAILVSMYFVNENIGWAVGEYNSGNNLFKTIDGGQKWQFQDVGEVCHLNAVYFTDEQNGWVAGFDYLNRRSCILHTEDGGKHWVNQKSPAKGNLNSVFFVGEKTGWVVGDGILKTIDGGTLVKVIHNEGQSNLPELFRLEQNYPNPFNANTNIRFYLKYSHFITLRVYDLMGKEVETLVNGYKSPGEYKLTWTAENVSSGMYLVRLQAGNNYKTKKLIVLK